MEHPSRRLAVIRSAFTASLFVILAGLIMMLGFDDNRPWERVLTLGTIIFASMIFVLGLRVHRREWLISPVAGIFSTLASAGYSITSYASGPCGGTIRFLGYPYSWLGEFTASNPSGWCVMGHPLTANPPAFFQGQLFLLDAMFYSLFSLAILELYFGSHVFRSTVRLIQDDLSLPHS